MLGRFGLTGAVVLAAGLCVPVFALVAAHDEECLDMIYSTPVENVVLPEGWSFGTDRYDILVKTNGGWSMSLDGPAVGQWSDGTDQIATATVSLQCVPAIDEFWSANQRANDMLGKHELRVVPVGDEARASSAIGNAAGILTTTSHIEWRRSDVVGALTLGQRDGDDPVPWEDLEDIALAFDALLE